MTIYRDRAFCVRSAVDLFGNVGCINDKCDRFAGPKVLEMAAKARVPIGWADLHTSKCGFIPREEEVER